MQASTCLPPHFLLCTTGFLCLDLLSEPPSRSLNPPSLPPLLEEEKAGGALPAMESPSFPAVSWRKHLVYVLVPPLSPGDLELSFSELHLNYSI